jgi:glutathione S-transferase
MELSQALRNYFYPQIMQGEAPNAELLKKLEDSLQLLEEFLKINAYVASDKMTLADFALVVTISMCEFTGYDLSKYPNIDCWLTMMKKTCPGWDINEEGLIILQKFISENKKN